MFASYPTLDMYSVYSRAGSSQTPIEVRIPYFVLVQIIVGLIDKSFRLECLVGVI